MLLFFSFTITEPKSKAVKRSTSRKKKKKRRGKPKKPNNAFFHFLAKERRLLGEDVDEIQDWAQWAKRAGRKWRRLSERKREPFYRKADKDRRRYEKEMRRRSKRRR